MLVSIYVFINICRLHKISSSKHPFSPKVLEQILDNVSQKLRKNFYLVFAKTKLYANIFVSHLIDLKIALPIFYSTTEKFPA